MRLAADESAAGDVKIMYPMISNVGEVVRANELLEERVAARTAELVEANAEIQKFAYIISHDLRSPLVNIMGFASELATIRAELAPIIGISPPTPVDASAAAHAAGFTGPLGPAATAVFARALAAGLAEQDDSALLQLLRGG